MQEHELQPALQILKEMPLLKLNMSWSQEPTNGLVNRPKLYQQTSEMNGMKKDSSNKDKASSSTRKNSTEHKNGKVNNNAAVILLYEMFFMEILITLL